MRLPSTSIFEVDSEREPDFGLPDGLRRLSTTPPAGYGSRVVVFDDGSVQYRVSAWKFCSQDCPNYGWIYRWDDAQEQVFTGKLDRTEIDRLQTLLRRDGKVLSGYANQGPQVGDFQILIHSASGQQSGMVIGLQPRWGISRPFTELIGEAKSIAHDVSKDATVSAWCRDSPSK